MDNARDLLAEVWREVGRHIEIHASATTIAAMLAAHMPLETLCVQRFDLARHALQTVALSRRGRREPHGVPPRALAADQHRRMVAWSAAGDVRRVLRGDARRGLSFLAPLGLDGDVLAGPLAVAGAFVGVLFFVACDGERFAAEHHRLAQTLLEPFAAALENDRRLHELATLREAAEAERRSLLTRMGRPEIERVDCRRRIRAAAGDGTCRAGRAVGCAGHDPG